MFKYEMDSREHPKIDRIACPWLIKRFIDRDYLRTLRTSNSEIKGTQRHTNGAERFTPARKIG